MELMSETKDEVINVTSKLLKENKQQTNRTTFNEERTKYIIISIKTAKYR